MAFPKTFYHYTDADGVEVIVEQLKDVPPEYQAQARIEPGKALPSAPLAPVAGESADQASPAAQPQARVDVPSSGRSLHWPSFAMGAGTALLVGLVLVLGLRRQLRVLSLVVGTLAVLALTVGYLTLLRHQLGLPSAGLATPAIILDDARNAAMTAQKQAQQQEQTLDQINNMR